MIIFAVLLFFYWVSSFSPVNGSDHRSSQKPNEQCLLPTLRHSDPSDERSFNEGLRGTIKFKGGNATKNESGK
jgi:hypothetical protein